MRNTEELSDRVPPKLVEPYQISTRRPVTRALFEHVTLLPEPRQYIFPADSTRFDNDAYGVYVQCTRVWWQAQQEIEVGGNPVASVEQAISFKERSTMQQAWMADHCTWADAPVIEG